MKNLKFTKKFALIFIFLTCLFMFFLYWYKQTYSLDTTNTFEVNNPSLDRKLLIAKQGSPFKDSITARVLDRYKSWCVVVEVIDVTALVNTDATNFDAILIMHRWEAGAPSETVQSFMDKNLELKNNMVILTTSWNGLEKMENIDAIAGASIVETTPIFTNKVIKSLDKLLKSKN